MPTAPPTAVDAAAHRSAAAVPSGTPAIPSGTPAVPSGTPAIPSGTPAIPSGTPAIPSGTPAISNGTPAVLQSAPDITGGGPLALVVTFLLAALFYAVTLHLAATFFIGDVPSQLAATVAPVPAVISLLLQQWGPAVVIPVTLLGDGLAVAYVYELAPKPATALTLLHFAFASVLGLALGNLLGVL